MVFVLAIARPLSNQTRVFAIRVACRAARLGARHAARWERTQRPLAVVIVLDWRELAGFSGCDGKNGRAR